ncbi:MAG: MBL fold metallo-hydrolase [Shimia sp.]
MLLILWPAVLIAQPRPSHCIAIAQTPGIEYLHYATFREEVPDFSVRIQYVDHAMFLIQTPTGASAATDYTGFLGMADFVPDVVTMNNSHTSHFTNLPDPRIPHVLEGWARDGVAAEHDILVGDLRVRNVPTDARGWTGGTIRPNGNSIFVFEVEGLCIGHLGHLHHEPDPAQYAALGRLDIVMAPVDGGFTLDRATMVKVLGRLRSSIVIPMHWFSPQNLEVFLTDMAADFDIQRMDDSAITVSLRSLPPRPTVMVLRPQFLRDTPRP